MSDKPRYRYNWKARKWDQLYTVKFNTILDTRPLPPLRYEQFAHMVATSDEDEDWSEYYLAACTLIAFIGGGLLTYIFLNNA